jgi:hypothetical protein
MSHNVIGFDVSRSALAFADESEPCPQKSKTRVPFGNGGRPASKLNKAAGRVTIRRVPGQPACSTVSSGAESISAAKQRSTKISKEAKFVALHATSVLEIDG